jgi:hypothetical protein
LAGGKTEHFVTVTFSINGQTVADKYPKEKPIEPELKKLLRDSGNSDDLSKYDYTVNGKDFTDLKAKFEVLPEGCTFVVSNKPGTKA